MPTFPPPQYVDEAISLVSESSTVQPPAVTRRAALRAVAGGAFVALCIPRQSAKAMPRMAPPIDIVGSVRVGPNAGLELVGRLWLDLTDVEMIPSGVLLGADGIKLADVDGASAGRVLNLRLRTTGGARLLLYGMLETDIYDSAGAITGLLSGPEPGDLGEWRGVSRAS